VNEALGMEWDSEKGLETRRRLRAAPHLASAPAGLARDRPRTGAVAL